MLKKMMTTTLLLLSVLTTQAHAAFISTDWKTAGDAKATLDESTGLEWLDLTVTAGKSPAQVQALFSTTLSGWRFATENEYRAMVTNFFGYNAIGKTPTVLDRNRWYDAFGVIGNRVQYSESSGWIASGNLNGNVVQSGFRGNGGSLQLYTYGSNSYFTSPVSYLGVWLVSDGGTTLSSINNPMLNVNNPSAPVNNQPEVVEPPVAQVSAPLQGASLMFGLMIAAMVRRKQRDAA